MGSLGASTDHDDLSTASTCSANMSKNAKKIDM